MRAIVLSGKYKKDLKLARKRNLPEDELNKVIFNLANDILLPPENKDHALLKRTPKARQKLSGFFSMSLFLPYSPPFPGAKPALSAPG